MRTKNALKERLERATQDYLELEHPDDWPVEFAATVIQNFCSIYGDGRLDTLASLSDKELGDQLCLMALGILGKLEQLLSDDLKEGNKRDYGLVLSQQRHTIAFSRYLSDRNKT